MSGYEVELAVLVVGGLYPVLWLGCRGRVEERLVALQFVTPVTALALLVLGVAVGPSSALIVPVVLTVLAAAGTLVFTRMVAPHGDADDGGQA